ncbi:hypothetical protein ACP70R_008640 [Stipagrostis hirtigluma subsp. patula]
MFPAHFTLKSVCSAKCVAAFSYPPCLNAPGRRHRRSSTTS